MSWGDVGLALCFFGLVAAVGWRSRAARGLTGVRRLVPPPPLEGRVPAGRVRVAGPAAAATALVRAVAQTHTVFLVGAPPPGGCPPGRVVLPVPEDPSRLAALLAVRSGEPCAVVVVASADAADEWEAALATRLAAHWGWVLVAPGDGEEAVRWWPGDG